MTPSTENSGSYPSPIGYSSSYFGAIASLGTRAYRVGLLDLPIGFTPIQSRMSQISLQWHNISANCTCTISTMPRHTLFSHFLILSEVSLHSSSLCAQELTCMCYIQILHPYVASLLLLHHAMWWAYCLLKMTISWWHLCTKIFINLYMYKLNAIFTQEKSNPT